MKSRMHIMLIKSPVKSSTTKTIFALATTCEDDTQNVCEETGLLKYQSYFHVTHISPAKYNNIIMYMASYCINM